MKKLFFIFFILAILVFSLCSCKEETMDDFPKSSIPSTTSTEKDASETLSEKLIREIDGGYLKEQNKSENQTTIGMIELADNYTKKWEQVADEYYNKIMKYNGSSQLDGKNYSAEELHIFVSDLKTEWTKDNKEKSDNYLKTLQDTYSGGTIIGPLFANYKSENQKEWALEMVSIYQQIYSE